MDLGGARAPLGPTWYVPESDIKELCAYIYIYIYIFVCCKREGIIEWLNLIFN